MYFFIAEMFVACLEASPVQSAFEGSCAKIPFASSS